MKNDTLFSNKYGHFSEDGFEFVVTRPDTPRPWINVISNGDFGLVVSQAGGGFSWRTHVNLNRLTRWNQDLVRDDWGKWMYLRDRDTGILKSLAFQPMQAEYKKYTVRHGLGYTVFEQDFGDLETKWVLFVSRDHPVEIWICLVRNKGVSRRRLQLCSYFEWNLGVGPDINREFHKLFIETRYCPSIRSIVALKNLWEVPSDRGHWNTGWPYIGFHSVNRDVSGWDTSKDHLIGRHGGFHNPLGIRKGIFTSSSGRFLDPSASLAIDMDLEPGEEKSAVFLLGQLDKDKNDSSDETGLIQNCIDQFGNERAAFAELDRVKEFWKEWADKTTIETPDRSLNLLTNIWLKYQTISGHLWARSGYYQQSGAFGFRDQLQSSQVWLSIEPSRTLEQIKLNARHQFHQGKMLHWWHPLTEKGLESDITDDMLWLPFLLGLYLKETNDYSALSQTVPYYDRGEGTLQEHVVKAVDVVLNRFSDRGLPLIGAGDWCDGFNAVGLKGKGESVWLAMFLHSTLIQWSEILEKRSPLSDPCLADVYRDRAARLKNAVHTHAWNGQWFIAATKDDGISIGDPSQEACKIYLNAQTWAVLSGVAEGEDGKKLMRTVLDRLECDNGLMLFSPAFQRPDETIGYITRYAPGLRENGGVYTHAATWGVLALACLGLSEETYRILSKLNPILQSQKDPDRYSGEPYVLPGNIDGIDSEWCGRAGWTWYTGSAGWLFRIILESVCGIRPVESGLEVRPCIPKEWPYLSMVRPFRGATYAIRIENPDHASGGIPVLFLDGKPLEGSVIPAQPGGHHEVRVLLKKKAVDGSGSWPLHVHRSS